MTIRVLVVDDQPLFCSGIRMLLDAQDGIVSVGAAHTGAEAIVQTRALTPDVVLMDLRMPDGNGLTATRAVVGLAGPPRVLVLTTFRDGDSARLAAEAGAIGVITKDATPETLISAVRAAAEGRSVQSEPSTRAMLSDPEARRPPDIGALDALTPREHEVFLHAAHGLSNAAIAALAHISENTVRTHVSAILRKLAVGDRRHLMRWAHEHGLLGR